MPDPMDTRMFADALKYLLFTMLGARLPVPMSISWHGTHPGPLLDLQVDPDDFPAWVAVLDSPTTDTVTSTAGNRHTHAEGNLCSQPAVRVHVVAVHPDGVGA